MVIKKLLYITFVVVLSANSCNPSKTISRERVKIVHSLINAAKENDEEQFLKFIDTVYMNNVLGLDRLHDIFKILHKDLDTCTPAFAQLKYIEARQYTATIYVLPLCNQNAAVTFRFPDYGNKLRIQYIELRLKTREQLIKPPMQ